MQRKWITRVITLGICILSLPTAALAASPQEPVIQLPSGGTTVVNMFANAGVLLPGDSADESYRLENTSEEAIEVTLVAKHALLADFGGDETQYRKSQALMEQLDLRLTLHYPDMASDPGGKLLHEGKLADHLVSGGTITYGLGLIPAEESAVLRVQIGIPTSLGNEFKQANTKFWWEITSIGQGEAPTEPPEVPTEPPVATTEPPALIGRPDPKPTSPQQPSQPEEPPPLEPPPDLSFPDQSLTITPTNPPADPPRRPSSPIKPLPPPIQPKEPEQTLEERKEPPLKRKTEVGVTKTEGVPNSQAKSSGAPYQDVEGEPDTDEEFVQDLTTIRYQEQPKFARLWDAWSLMNLFLAFDAALATLFRLWRRKKGDPGRRRGPKESVRQQPFLSPAERIRNLLPPAIGIFLPALFFMLEDTSALMVMVNFHTIPIAALALLQHLLFSEKPLIRWRKRIPEIDFDFTK